jgi:hypothetical protein
VAKLALPHHTCLPVFSEKNRLIFLFKKFSFQKIDFAPIATFANSSVYGDNI